MSKQTIAKLVILSSTAVGKSCTFRRFLNDEFVEFYETTIGAAFRKRCVQLENRTVEFEIWDTADQRRQPNPRMIYRGAATALVVYDITSFDSFISAKRWVDELQRDGRQGIVIGLAGNKLDLEEYRQVDMDEAQQFANNRHCVFFETSAKTGENVQKMFEHIAVRLCNGEPHV